VYRERPETGAVECRLAPTFVRFGTFEVGRLPPRSRQQWAHTLLTVAQRRPLARSVAKQLLAHRRQADDMRRLVEYVRQRCCAATVPPNDAVAFLDWVVRVTADTVARWQSLGFVHGVLNTDNMSICGLTLDDGPFGFLDRYDPTWTSNAEDWEGRYRFSEQPEVVRGNLERLADALTLIVPAADHARLYASVATFRPLVQLLYLDLMRARLGLELAESGDAQLVAELLEWMTGTVDYNAFLRALAENPPSPWNALRCEPLESIVGGPAWPVPEHARAAWEAWLDRYRRRLARDGPPSRMANPEGRRAAMVVRRERMAHTNPKYVLRTHIAEEVVAAAQAGDFAPLRRLQAVLASPFVEHGPEFEAWTRPPPPSEMGRRCSCSS